MQYIDDGNEKRKMIVLDMEPKCLAWQNNCKRLPGLDLRISKIFLISKDSRRLERNDEIMNQDTKVAPDRIFDLFVRKTRYATPKMDSRAVVMRKQQILLVREKSDVSRSLPVFLSRM